MQWTGINAIVAFSPFIFQGLGGHFQGETGSLLATMIVGAVQVKLKAIKIKPNDGKS